MCKFYHRINAFKSKSNSAYSVKGLSQLIIIHLKSNNFTLLIKIEYYDIYIFEYDT